jgi:hypothetical protein
MSLALVIGTGGCQAPEQAEQPSASGSADAGAMSDAAETASAPSLTQDDTPPPATTPIRVGSPEDAVRAYYAAIDAGEFARAYRLWGQDGEASGQSYAQFRQGFAATRSTQVTISGPVESEGAAGSIYATVPVTVDATLKDGTRQRFAGEYVLRRVNDVPGASEEQLNWHIESASLKPA